MLKVVNVVGARPNFMKIAPILAAMHRADDFQPVLVHTGQHYDERMSRLFFSDLGLPAPDLFLGVGSGSHAQQTARVLETFEPVVERMRPDWVVVVGDVNSTLAGALAARKLGVRVAHVEAGLRCGDRDMPEEINRVLTDALSDLLLTPSRDAEANLLREGIPPSRIAFVGNVMIDTLLQHRHIARRTPILRQLGLAARGYGVVTLHRPANVDDSDHLRDLLQALRAAGGDLPLVFPVHPRTQTQIERLSNWQATPGLRLVEPLGYLEFLGLLDHARLVLTDSGGIQEETTVLGVPCLTLRDNTERPVTLTHGTNRLVGTDPAAILPAVRAALVQALPVPAAIEGWDGHAAGRVLEALRRAGRSGRG